MQFIIMPTDQAACGEHRRRPPGPERGAQAAGGVHAHLHPGGPNQPAHTGAAPRTQHQGRGARVCAQPGQQSAAQGRVPRTDPGTVSGLECL
jgi:hypothetical protein